MPTKVTFKPNPAGSLTFEIVAEKDVDLFAKIARLQDVFGDKECGLCHSDDIKYQTRKARNQKGQEFTYHELVCQKCNGRLQFGQHNNAEGTLFTKRENRQTNGWVPPFSKQGGNPVLQKQVKPPQQYGMPVTPQDIRDNAEGAYDDFEPEDLSSDVPF